MGKAKTFVASAITMSVVATPFLANNAFAGITDPGSGVTNSHTEVVRSYSYTDLVYDVDLSNGQRYKLSGDLAEMAAASIEEHGVNNGDEKEICGAFLADGFVDGESEENNFFCFAQNTDGVFLYADNIPDTITTLDHALLTVVDGEMLNTHTYFLGVTLNNNQVINVGDPDTIDPEPSSVATYNYEERQTWSANRYYLNITYGDGYAILEGGDQTYALGGEGLTVHASGSYEDDFSFVEVDGKVVDSSNYDGKAGSTIITLHDDYLAGLSLGEHTLRIVYDGGEVETTFTLTDNPDTADALDNMIALLITTSVLSLGFAYKAKAKTRR